MATECSGMLRCGYKWQKKYGEESFRPTETHFLDDEEMKTEERKEQIDKVKASEGRDYF